MSMPHSLNCSNPLVVSGLGAIGNYIVGKRKAGVSNNQESLRWHTVENCSLCLETSCTSWIYILLESFEVVSPTSLFQGKDLWLSLFSREITSCKSHLVNDTIIIMSPNFAEFLLDTTNNGNEILAVLEDIVEVTETGGTDL